ERDGIFSREVADAGAADSANDDGALFRSLWRFHLLLYELNGASRGEDIVDDAEACVRLVAQNEAPATSLHFRCGRVQIGNDFQMRKLLVRYRVGDGIDAHAHLHRQRPSGYVIRQSERL